MRLNETIRSLLGFFRGTEKSVPALTRGPVDHIVLLDGTMSTLDEGCETNIGLIYKTLQDCPEAGNLGLYYESGLQWRDWSMTMSVIEGRGINKQIRRAYGYLASRYTPGDRIFLLGYSRGAFAVRSLAGVIERVGLLKKEEATVRMIRNAYRHYSNPTDAATTRAFRDRFCHASTPIEMVGVFDTVKALGIKAPFVRRWSKVQHSFHNDALGQSVRHGFHALALNETREAFSPLLWRRPADYAGHMEQVWFRGTHGDIGGQLNGKKASRPLSNIPLTWMLSKISSCNICLPEDWEVRFPTDASAPSIGPWHGWAKFFWVRRRRVVGVDASERLHPTAVGHGFVPSRRGALARTDS